MGMIDPSSSGNQKKIFHFSSKNPQTSTPSWIKKHLGLKRGKQQEIKELLTKKIDKLGGEISNKSRLGNLTRLFHSHCPK